MIKSIEFYFVFNKFANILTEKYYDNYRQNITISWEPLLELFNNISGCNKKIQKVSFLHCLSMILPNYELFKDYDIKLIEMNPTNQFYFLINIFLNIVVFESDI